MKISVCMTTYNGERYLDRQLLSLLHQTRLPEEIVAADDGSRDRTTEILHLRKDDFTGRGCSFRLPETGEHLGYPAVFYHAASFCTGDLLFFADQDDIWKKDKIERMEEVFMADPGISLLCCKYVWIDEAGRKRRSVLPPVISHESGRVRRVTLEQVLTKCEWPGMTLACRREWYERQVSGSSLQDAGIPHDLFLCLRGAEEGVFGQLDLVLAGHRIWNDNTSAEAAGLRERLSRKKKLSDIRTGTVYLQRVQESGILRSPQGRSCLEEKLRYSKSRYHALRTGDRGQMLRNAARYRRILRPASLLCDLWIAKQRM